MTNRILFGGRRSGRNLAALIAVASMPGARMVIEAAKRADETTARTIVLTGPVSGLEVGKTILIGDERYQIAGIGRGPAQRLIELVERNSAVIEPERPAPAFGSDRPYLKRKKGRS